MDTEEKPSSGCTPFTEDHNYAATSVIHTFGLERFASSPEDTQHYTRFPSYKHLRAFWNLIEESTSRMERVTSGQRNLPTNTPLESPVNRPSKLLPFDEFFLFLNYLATGNCICLQLNPLFIGPVVPT
uniref:Uncharacterized protein n=1 Tax=Knipowitschia caucasica TaxID=637954 RepID=A0AAV2J8D5_KNICA